MIKFFPVPFAPKPRWAALLILLAAPLALFGQAEKEYPKELANRTSDQLGKLRELTESKNFDGALALINDLIGTVPADSYDRAILSQIKAQVLLTQGNYSASIEPLETALRMGDNYGYFEPRQNQELAYLLSQLYYQEAAGTKGDSARQVEYFDRAASYIRRYLANAAKPNPEAQLFAASILYSRATLDEANIDMALVAEARTEAEKGLLLEIKPRDNFYVLILATLQQEGKIEESAELLEFLVKQNPTNTQYWQQLAASYLNLAAGAGDDSEEAYNWHVRSILAIERAQKLGIMNTPADNFNLVGIYFNIQRFDQAVALLEKGLRDGSIVNEQRNWELLASSYQQVQKELKAIDTLKEATKLYPESGPLEFQIANIYYSINNMADAYKHGLAALEKGGLPRPSQVQMFVAYLAYELQDLDEALKQAKAAASDPEAENADRLVRAIEEAIEERERLLNETTI